MDEKQVRKRRLDGRRKTVKANDLQKFLHIYYAKCSP